ncbi:hypothetical protein GGR50DRAFT_464697 [Xylaria sp. CBS 124048]|nr:hypothetical protein GGR50DRAFT_464697 [Xylaria sp. CBS 124048]
MKVLITGASGLIGGECLKQCLSHPSVAVVVAFVRCSLASEISAHPKLKQVIIEDFAKWPQGHFEGTLRCCGDHMTTSDSDSSNGRTRAMGTYRGSPTADFDCPLGFLRSMAPVLEAESKVEKGYPFRYIQLSGKFTRGDQDKKLWFMECPRKLKGPCDVRILEFADAHKDSWKISVVKPGAVGTETMLGTRMASAIMGSNWSVLIEEVGAFMTYLVVDGAGESAVVENGRIVQRGREILQSQLQSHS